MTSSAFPDVDPVRRRIMSAVRGKDTSIEMAVRRSLHADGYRYALHPAKLPGRPDLAFSARKAALFLHGCFWHGHAGCPKAREPKTRREFWIPKLARNRERDVRNVAALEALGWRVLVVWECELNSDRGATLAKIREFLGKTSMHHRGN